MPRYFGGRRHRAIVVLAAVAATFVVSWTGAHPASAHGSATGSEPASGAVLRASPQRLQVVFDEEVYRVRSPLVLRSTTGTHVVRDASFAGRVVAGHADRPLPGGVYTLFARARSSDNHPIERTISFAVLPVPQVAAMGHAAASSAAATDTAMPTAGGAHSSSANAALTAGRAAEVLGFAILGGGAVALLVLILPGLQTKRLPRRRLVIALGGAGLLLTGRAVQVWAGAAAFTDPDTSATVSTVLDMVSSASGRFQLALMLSTVGAIAASTSLVLGNWRATVGAAGIAGLGVLLGGHGDGATVVVAGTHLVAASVWVGALAVVALWLPCFVHSRRFRSVVGRRTAGLCGSALAVLVGTGAIRWILVDDATNDYRATLAVKLGIAGVVALVAILSWRRMQSPAAAALWATVAVELAGVSVVVVLAAALGSTAGREPAPTVETVASGEDATARIEIGPGRVGHNTVRVTVTSTDGGGLVPADVVLRSHAFPISARRVTPETSPNGDLVARGVVLAVPGVWEAIVTVRGPGGDAVELSAPFLAADDDMEMD